jgi:hypothetical protein
LKIFQDEFLNGGLAAVIRKRAHGLTKCRREVKRNQKKFSRSHKNGNGPKPI